VVQKRTCALSTTTSSVGWRALWRDPPPFWLSTSNKTAAMHTAADNIAATILLLAPACADSPRCWSCFSEISPAGSKDMMAYCVLFSAFEAGLCFDTRRAIAWQFIRFLPAPHVCRSTQARMARQTPSSLFVEIFFPFLFKTNTKRLIINNKQHIKKQRLLLYVLPSISMGHLSHLILTLTHHIRKHLGY
jgi:hypothetical protein